MNTTHKKIYLLLYLLFLGSYIDAQVGINTRIPQGIFHLDGWGDTATDSNISDDIVITPDGLIGVGTNKPTANLDVRGTFKYVDNNQSNEYLLKSDKDGNANWAEQTINNLVYANGATNHNIGSIFTRKTVYSGASLYTGINITLPPGTWMITFCATFMLDKTGISGTPLPSNIWWDLSKSNTTNLPFTGRVLSCSIGGTGTDMFAPVNAALFVTHTETTTYYIWGKTNRYTFRYSGEGYMWAMELDPRQ